MKHVRLYQTDTSTWEGRHAASTTRKSNIAHFRRTLGVIPEPIKVMLNFTPSVFDAYVAMRREVMAEGTGHLPLKMKELIFVVLDVCAGNLSGAKNHVRAAVRAGLTIPELAEALIQVMMVQGIATWGMTGHKVLQYAAGLSPSGPRASADRRGPKR